MNTMIVKRRACPPQCGEWHRHLLYDLVDDNSGWILGESADGVLVQFLESDDRLNFVRAVSSRDVKSIPLPELRVYVCVKYAAGCSLCDERAIYHE